MHMRSRVAGAALALATGAALVLAAQSASASPAPAKVHTAKVCAAAVRGFASCLAVVRTDLRVANAIGPNTTPSGYGPTDLRSAYNLTSSGSSTQTVAIVDAYDDPTAEADLAVYRAQYGLSACTTANGCFRKVDQNGGTSYPSVDAGWAQEISLDLRHGLGDLPELPHPARRGDQRVVRATSARR